MPENAGELIEGAPEPVKPPVVDTPEEKPKRPRKTSGGEKKTSGKTKKELPKSGGKTPTLDEATIARNIMGLHMMLSIATTPKAMISPENAQAMAHAIYDVMQQFDMEWLGKYLPFVNLFGTVVVCEAPTVIALAQWIREKREGGNPNGEGTVYANYE